MKKGITAIIAIVFITALAGIAMYWKIDLNQLIPIVAVIAGLGGYAVRNPGASATPKNGQLPQPDKEKE